MDLVLGNNDLLKYIFATLTQIEMLPLRLVCKNYNQLILELCTSIDKEYNLYLQEKVISLFLLKNHDEFTKTCANIRLGKIEKIDLSKKYEYNTNILLHEFRQYYKRTNIKPIGYCFNDDVIDKYIDGLCGKHIRYSNDSNMRNAYYIGKMDAGYPIGEILPLICLCDFETNKKYGFINNVLGIEELKYFLTNNIDTSYAWLSIEAFYYVIKNNINIKYCRIYNIIIESSWKLICDDPIWNIIDEEYKTYIQTMTIIPNY